MTEETARGDPAGGSGPDTGVTEEGDQPRGKWANKRESLLAMTGLIIGLGNFWRFPYLCYRNGGVAFFIPYFLCLLFCGIPVLFLEMALGQYTSEGGVTVWKKICPMFQGVGIASQVILAYLNIYYIVILVWALVYLYYSFKSTLPWSTCDNFWNTDVCQSRPSSYANPNLFQPDSNWSFLHNVTSLDYFDEFSPEVDNEQRTSETEFWMYRVLRVSHDMTLGPVNWDLAACLLLAWIVCYLCIFRGIKSAGKVVYVTATVPYLLLFILFIRGVTLPGAGDGMKHFLYPELYRLAGLHAWCDALSEVLSSYSVCLGVVTALGSYNKYNNNCYRDCLVLCCLNTGTSIFAGLAVFSVLGFMAHDMGVSLHDVVNAGPGLVFQAFPKALSMLPGASFWCVLFFLMILFLALDAQFLCVESLVTAIADLFPHHLRNPRGRSILVLVICVVCFLLGLPHITQGGIIVFHLLDHFGASENSMLFIVCFETTVIAWVYGADRFYDNIEDMIGYKPFPVLKYCWLFITLLLCWLFYTFSVHTLSSICRAKNQIQRVRLSRTGTETLIRHHYRP
ncbi:sodium- and chloride-dependent betaine transporter-like isoform X3 [Epinephelus moara]|uniref:sodium- and chloride-dependent betaine transporter-like isoform X3 n=1 Tax=Epinephelus moara TaxID=300413 RepID=UPI00214F4865|nr:sodium- and chloride-dependent betaine transporter-like isoform X3 [Epinephelus moara]